MSKIETNGETKNLEPLKTTKNKPVAWIGLDKILGIKLETEKTNLKIHYVQEDPNETELKRKSKKLFHENKTVKGIEVDSQLKLDAKLMLQKGRPIPIHIQPAVGKEIEK